MSCMQYNRVTRRGESRVGHMMSQTGRPGWDVPSGRSCPGQDVPDGMPYSQCPGQDVLSGTSNSGHDVPDGMPQTGHMSHMERPIWDIMF